jgi:small subunit ribosomal protein S13
MQYVSKMAEKEESNKEKIRLLVRVANTDLAGEKQILHAMTKIKGVSTSFSNAVVTKAGVDPIKKAGLLTDAEVAKLEKVVLDPTGNGIPSWLFNRQDDYETGKDGHLLNADLKFTKENDIKRLMRIKSNRGLRHSWRLPLRGQRTKSNFRRSKARTASAAKRGRKAPPAKR